MAKGGTTSGKGWDQQWQRKGLTMAKGETNTGHKICFEEKNTEKGETNTGHKYVLNSIQAHMP